MIVNPYVFAQPAVNGWNPSRVGSNIALSGTDNVVATKSGSSAWHGVNAIGGVDAASANHYYEATGSGWGHIMLGVSKGDVTLAGAYAMAYTHLYFSYGQKYDNGSYSGDLTPYANTDRVGILLKNGKMYCRKNGTWINSCDPETESNPIVSGLTGTYYPMAVMYDAGACTIHSTSGTVTGSLPTGAVLWAA